MNITGFVHESLVPVRKTPAHPSEMVNQLVFGDMVRILDRAYNWFQVQAADDGYVGWVPSTMVEPVSEAFIATDQPFKLVYSLVAPVRITRGGMESTIYVCKGARFPVFSYREKEDELMFRLGEITLRMEERHLTDPLPALPEAIAETARTYLNVPYLWGGKSPFGADCSGFVQMLFRLHGISLKRDSNQQAQQGKPVNWADRQPGHLAFFRSPGGQITHVGYLLDRDNIIHGTGRVRIDRLTQEGIYNAELRTITHRLQSLRNLL